VAEHFANEFATTLVGTITGAATSLVVATSSGAPGVNFRIRIDNEYLLVTAGPPGSTTWTVARAQEGSVAATHQNGAAVTHVLTAGGLAQAITDRVPIIRLDYVGGSMFAGTAITATVEFTFLANQNFTVGSSGSVIELSCRGNAQVGGVSGVGGVASRLYLDSAGANTRYDNGGQRVVVSGEFGNPFGGNNSIFVAGLSAGTHTINVKLISEITGVVYQRGPSTVAESFGLQVIEH
jgi:hypothetical protein